MDAILSRLFNQNHTFCRIRNPGNT